MNAARVMFSATILLTYPFECFVAREVLKSTLLCGRGETTTQHVGISLFLVLVTLMLSMVTDCLGIVLELNVSTFSTALLKGVCSIQEKGSTFSNRNKITPLDFP
jgi:solute carrier family 38 (sodium-coupled neutral amino acid transporter), member 11